MTWTGTRVPLITGFPPITFGSIEIRFLLYMPILSTSNYILQGKCKDILYSKVQAHSLQ